MSSYIKNLFTGVSYAAVKLSKKYDLGVAVIKFRSDGRACASIIEFIKDYSELEEAELSHIASSFRCPFLYSMRGNVLTHPVGWVWEIGKKRRTLNAAYKDFLKYKTVVNYSNQKFKTLIRG